MPHLLLQRIIIWWYTFWGVCVYVFSCVYAHICREAHMCHHGHVKSHLWISVLIFNLFWPKIILSFPNTYGKLAIQRVSPISKSVLPSCHTVLELKTNTVTSSITWALESWTQTLALTQKVLYMRSHLTSPNDIFREEK